jgi:peptidoglycan lytic transglycosylase G
MGRLRRLTALGILLVVAVPALLLLWRWYGPGPSGRPTTVLVPEGATVTSTANNLQRLGVISSARWFRAGAKLFGSHDPVQAGEFEIRKGMSAASILELLQHGRPVQRLITVTEGMPSIVVEEKIASNRYLTGPMPAIAEGSLLPDSYSYERAEARTAVVQRMQTAMARAVDALWPKRDYVCPIVTKEQAVTLASIVEKETGKASERPMIAGVYCNRLKIGMKLDADPTVIYPVTKGKPLGRRILRSELNSDSPYNTYRHAGLPPGPIANPGKASIEAVLHPAKTKAIYFVADGTGGHVFADTFAQHQANVARWYQIRRERGQM